MDKLAFKWEPRFSEQLNQQALAISQNELQAKLYQAGVSQDLIRPLLGLHGEQCALSSVVLHFGPGLATYANHALDIHQLSGDFRFRNIWVDIETDERLHRALTVARHQYQ